METQYTGCISDVKYSDFYLYLYIVLVKKNIKILDQALLFYILSIAGCK